MNGQAPTGGARVMFLIRVPAERTRDFLEAYEKIRYTVAEGVEGHLRDQVCRAEDDPEQWMITSEWTSLEAFRAWERSPGHRTLAGPMRACCTEATSLRFAVQAETSRRHTVTPRDAGIAPRPYQANFPRRAAAPGRESR